MTFQPGRILEVLAEFEVQFILVGGMAAQAHGSQVPTTDVDITPLMDVENLERLARALQALGAGIRVSGVPEGLPFNTDARAIQGLGFLNLTTPYGDLDLTLMPAGTSGYPDLVQQAVVGHVGPIAVRVASLDDIIRSKTAAG